MLRSAVGLPDVAGGPKLVVGGPLTRRNHDQATLLSTPLEKGLVDMARSQCHGTHSFGRPMMALLAKKNLGPVRHVLSQMVVAGVMIVSPPVQVRVSESSGIEPGRGEAANEGPTSTSSSGNSGVRA